MKKVALLIFLSSSIVFNSNAQKNFYQQTPEALRWVDSVFGTLTKEQKIAQLMIIRAHSNLGKKHVDEVTSLINKYNVGGLCFFQGGPIRQANLTNYYQSIAKTPLMISIDGEWGLGMRLDSVINFPRQLMMGAVPDAALIYQFGKAVGEQCKRLGIHVNFAPDVDVNNNPNNPVINDRSFGEDKYKVALFGVQYMKGMQDVGVMACAKHFPGHGDVDVDSHYDLPIINKNKSQLNDLELYPFKEMFKAGVGSVMVAHLYIPAIDNTANQATSLSKKNVTGLLRNELGYNGLTFTDALEMKGVAKFYPAGEASVQSLIAGNDMLCLPGDIDGSIKKILQAIKQGKLSWADIDNRVKKVLLSKYHLGLNKVSPIVTEGIVADINKHTQAISQSLSAAAITLLQQKNPELLPLQKGKKIAFVGIGINSENSFAASVKSNYNADAYYFDYNRDLGTVPMLVYTLQQKYDAVVIGLHGFSRRPANNFGLSAPAIRFMNELQQAMPSITFVFGNPYAIKNACNAPNIVACYEDDKATQLAAADVLMGKLPAKGKLPVTVCDNFRFGSGITYNPYFPVVAPESVGLSTQKLQAIDAVAKEAIQSGATPGCVVLVARKGKVAFQKAYGYLSYDSTEAVQTDAVYDLASVTKISATTVAVMKLVEEGRLDLKKTIGDYLSWVKGSNKAPLTIENILLHQAGLVAWIPFFRATYDTTTGKAFDNIYASAYDEQHQYRVADNMYMRNDWVDTMRNSIIKSKLGPADKYVYSDNDFIFLGNIVEAITGMTLADYVRKTFYLPLHMSTTVFQPRNHLALNTIAPTEKEKMFRQQLLRGDVHDPGAAMFGGIAGHAGLFSSAYDLAQLYQMLLNGGTMNGVQYLKKETIDQFTAYNSTISRRGLGFDKPEKDNATRKEPYPSLSVSTSTFGHTGFTGTCVWADPQQDLVYIFLSNRVHPEGGDNGKLGKLNIRPRIQEIIYSAITDK